MRRAILFSRTFIRIAKNAARVLAEPLYMAIAIASAILFLAVNIFIPVWLIPSNSFSFELTIISPLEGGLLVAIALLAGALAALETFAFRRGDRMRIAREAGKSGIGLVASMIGGLIATSCGCGMGIVLGLVGLSGEAVFVVAHQTAIIGIMLAIVAYGLYLSAKRASGICAS